MNDIDNILNKKIQDIYTIHKLPLKKYGSYCCGYISGDGKCYECEPYGHTDMMYLLTHGGELTDEYEKYVIDTQKRHNRMLLSYGRLSSFDAFALIYLGWIKIVAYADSDTCRNQIKNMRLWTYDWSYVTVRDLTEAQTNIIFKS